MRLAAALLLFLASHPVAAALPACAATVDGLRALLQDPAFPLTWEETTMADARPLLVTLDERDGALHLSIHKTGEGRWAAGHARVCGDASGLEARYDAASLHVGPAAGWLLRQGLQAGAAVTLRRLPAGELRIGTVGWSSRFAPATPQIGLRAR
ncbi:MAG TPA: hypothetical protein VNB23_13200 [Ramlibacter sp.]|nr:hypothetical protein [Ramlibacter sp.]